ncbi:MAG: F0F1 ATP synthase subunit gamma [Verrucomicrobiota bacterium]
MSDTLESLRRKIIGAGELESVVRTMKALAAASIGQYEKAVQSLADYYRTVELGLAACFRESVTSPTVQSPAPVETPKTGAIVFGSDQGLVGQFNEVLGDYAAKTLGAIPGQKTVWAIGERMHARLAHLGLPPLSRFAVPNSVNGITPLVVEILTKIEAHRAEGKVEQIYVFHNRPRSGAIYEPVSQRLFPLDEQWRRALGSIAWPTQKIPEVMNHATSTVLALVREYVFVCLFKACAESLASENASRLAAMRRAEKNIDELLEDLGRTFHRLRQSSIDEELFDVISGFEALTTGNESPSKAIQLKGKGTKAHVSSR